MGFQTGTTIRPELGNADYSGFANAASIQANALASFGSQIGEGIEKYKKNKDITSMSLGQLEALTTANPEAYAELRASGGDIAKSLANIEDGNYKQRDVLSSLGALQTSITQKDQQQQNLMAQQKELISQQNQEALNKAMAVNTDTEGNVDYSRILPFYLELGGQDPKMVSDLVEYQYNFGQASTGRVVTREQLDAMSASANVKAIALPDGNFEVESLTTTPGSNRGGPTGRPVSMEEIDELVQQGYKPDVEVDSQGNNILTGFGTFAPRDESVPLTSGQDKLLETMAADLAPWYTGGRQQAEANLVTYDSLVNKLISGEVETRNISDLAPEALGISDFARQLVNPSGQEAVDRVRQIVFQGLKDTLGAQFTQREAERLVSASYNPALDEKTNIDRLQDARNVLSDVIDAKNALAKHIAEGGGPGDFEGVLPSEVLRSGILDIESNFGAETGGTTAFRVPSGIVIKEKK